MSSALRQDGLNLYCAFGSRYSKQSMDLQATVAFNCAPVACHNSFRPSSLLRVQPRKNLHTRILERLERDFSDARDAFTLAKVNQAHFTNKKRHADNKFKVGEFAMLGTLHHRRDYTQAGDGRTAKFMPRWDGKYEIIEANSAPPPPGTNWPYQTLRVDMPLCIRRNSNAL